MEVINKSDTLYTWITKINKNFSAIDEKFNEDVIATDLKVKDGVLYNSLGYAICNYYSTTSNINVTIDNALNLMDVENIYRLFYICLNLASPLILNVICLKNHNLIAYCIFLLNML